MNNKALTTQKASSIIIQLKAKLLSKRYNKSETRAGVWGVNIVTSAGVGGGYGVLIVCILNPHGTTSNQHVIETITRGWQYHHQPSTLEAQRCEYYSVDVVQYSSNLLRVW